MHDQDMYARNRSPAGEPVEPATVQPATVEPAVGYGEDYVAEPGSRSAPVAERGFRPAPVAGSGSRAAAVAETAKETAKEEARTVAQTARQEAGAVVDEAKDQVRRLASEARDQATTRVREQHGRLVDKFRAASDELGEMAGNGDSPVRAVVSDLAQRGRRVANYLDHRGPEGVLSDVQDLARRRPVAFLAGATVAGFLVGRLGKNIWKAQSETASADVVTVQPVVAPVEVTPAGGAPLADPYAATPYAATALDVDPAIPPQTDPYRASPYASETYPEEEPVTYGGGQYPGGEPR